MSAPTSIASRATTHLRTHWADWSAGLLVVVVCALLLTPALLGRMPLSGDHPVHLARAVLTAEQLGQGRLAGWSDRWFLGFPVGELYPQLGDLLVILIGGVTRVSWPTAYAWAFFLIFTAQALALLRAGRVIGLGVLPGVAAALFCCFDIGAYREGGWTYTVSYGVWPQGLSNALMWLGLAELWASREPADAGDSKRHLVFATLALSLSVLAHPIALPLLVVALPLLIVVGTWMQPATGQFESTWQSFRASLADQCSKVAWVCIFSIGLCAWFVVPMLSARGYMASYGWLHVDLRMLGMMVRKGVWAQNMPPAVGAAAALGLALAVLRPLGFLRYCGILAVLLWVLSASDTFWTLRLDWLSDSFSYLQYQRFLTAAKPGLWLCAGAVLGQLWVLALALAHASQVEHTTPEGHDSSQAISSAPTAALSRPMLRLGAMLSAALLAVFVVFIGQQVARRVEKSEIGRLVTQRVPVRGEPVDQDVLALFDWLEKQWTASDEFYRVSFEISRNEHWLMDAPVYTGTPIYRAGFTPGDNFVHKPESTRDEVLDAARVRFRVVRSATPTPLRDEVAAFGTLRVLQREGPIRKSAWIEADPKIDTEAVDDASATDQTPSAAPGSKTRTKPRKVSYRKVERTIHALASEPSAARSTGDPRRSDALRHEADVSAEDLVLGERETSRWLVFAVAGHTRWHLFKDGVEIPWQERPLYGDEPPIDPTQRLRGLQRGGKANGDDGTEPTLVAINVSEHGAGHYELRYVTRQRTHGWLGLLVLLSVLGLTAAMRKSADARNKFDDLGELVHARLLGLLATAAHPAVLALALLGVTALTVPRVLSHRNAEAQRLIGLAAQPGRVELKGFSRGLIKTEMRIEPALIFELVNNANSSILVRALKIDDEGAKLAGWIALDDDDGKIGRRGESKLTVSARGRDESEWTEVLTVSVRQRPGKEKFELDLARWSGQAVDLRLDLRSDGQSRTGLDVDLSGAIVP